MMVMTWFLPMGLAIGAAGTRMAIRSHQGPQAGPRDAGRWLLALGWLPCFCWILAQVVGQY